ncbi:MAG: hypothetical protein N3I35_03385 [Clostridia bacterium]|nr:hypothetical protein [Clostridia bacterium]
MYFDAEIIREKSMDPYFKIKFSYVDKDFIIKAGIAEVIRKAPVPQITYDYETRKIIEDKDRSKLELELLNVIISYLLSAGISRTYKGRVVLSA